MGRGKGQGARGGENGRGTGRDSCCNPAFLGLSIWIMDKKHPFHLAAENSVDSLLAHLKKMDGKYNDYEYPKVSIIIPVYNASQKIALTLDSLVHQNYPDFEILVIDAGSTDRTLEIVKQYKNIQVYYRSRVSHADTPCSTGGFRRRGHLRQFSLPRRLLYLPRNIEMHHVLGFGSRQARDGILWDLAPRWAVGSQNSLSPPFG